MAALDFPATPAVDQTYGAPNGITYKWTGTVWVAIGGSTSPPAGYAWDARATSTTTNMVHNAWTKLPFNTIAVEQGGAKFDIALNRVTPPAGLYSVTVQMRLNGSGVAAYMAIQLYKNGVPMAPPAIPTPIATAFANKYQSISASWLAQVNGSDYLEAWGMQSADNSGTFTLDGPDCLFTGFAVSGVKGAPGEPYPGTVGGDFMATRTSMSFVTTTAAVCLFDTMVSGNSGNWYNPANGRFTPPAGRYSIFASAGWASSSAVIGIEVVIRKNGVQAGYAYTAPAANEHAESVAKAQLDANGTDYFDVTLRSSGPTPSVSFMPATFMAFPLTGVKGPPGDPYPGTVGGDFCVLGIPGSSLPGSLQTALAANVVSGNSGGWYVPATGRFTPPAGRYAIKTHLNGQGSAASNMFVSLRKNGAEVARSVDTATQASYFGAASIAVTLDANGIDWFDVQVMAGSGGTIGFFEFSAYPISGVKGPPGDPHGYIGGDFSAVNSMAIVSPASTYFVLVPNTVSVGNSGNYYNPVNGRYTPPAGRFYLYGYFSASAPGAACGMRVNFRKNGVDLPGYAWATSASGQWNDTPALGLVVDASGSDYFEMVGMTGVSANIVAMQFMAFPLSGIKGPPGDKGPAGDMSSALKLYSEAIATAGATELRVNFPAGAKRVELEFGLTAASLAANVDVRLQGLVGSTPDAAAVYNTLGDYAYHNAVGPVGFYNGNRNDWTLCGFLYAGGTIRFPMINVALDATNKQQTALSDIWANQATYGRMHQWASHDKYDASVWTGYRLLALTGAFAAGSYLRCYVVV